jgi:hypothetical protein
MYVSMRAGIRSNEQQKQPGYLVMRQIVPKAKIGMSQKEVLPNVNEESP